MTKTILEPNTKTKVEIAAKFDPEACFQDRKGLFVWNSFKERIVSKAKPIEKTSEIEIASYKLLEYATDEKIEAALPEKHIFDESEVCAIIAALIERQPNGEDGMLATGWDYNLFYTPAFVVSVDWGDTGWSVGTWSRDGSAWYDDLRVFSPAD